MIFNSEDIWLKQDAEFVKIEKKVKIPNSMLDNVPNITLKNKNDFENIPDLGGCYWIWTNEPIIHRLHKRPIPKKVQGGEIIYNGIAKDNIRSRVKNHLI